MTYNNIFGQNQFQSYVPVSGPANAIFQPGFAGTNPQEVRQDYIQSQQNQQFPAVSSTYATGGFGTAANVFQPGFAGTNVQEVRQDYAQSQRNQQFPQVSSTYASGGFGTAANVFQPGFAGTNVQEVRQDYLQSQQSAGNFGAGFNTSGVNQSFGFAPQFSSANSVFQPGFAGTNVQEVRARNASAGNFGGNFGGGFGFNGGISGGANSVFQPGFAGTNVQEVRGLNAGFGAPAVNQQPYGAGYNVGGNTGFSQFSGQTGVNSVFQPGFAGTNVQEVRQDYAQSQQNAPFNVGIPYRSF